MRGLLFLVRVISPGQRRGPARNRAHSGPTRPSNPIMPFSSVNEKIGRHRWTICGLVFAATTINYLDRQVLGLLKQSLSDGGVFGSDPALQELAYSRVVMCFQIAYAAGMLLAGRVIDKIGTKKGY